MKNCKNNNICPVIEVFSLISKKWVLLILKSIWEGCKNFSEIEKSLICANPRILSTRLNELQKVWFVEKKIISKSPLKAIYCLTNKWEWFFGHIDKISSRAEKNLI